MTQMAQMSTQCAGAHGGYACAMHNMHQSAAVSHVLNLLYARTVYIKDGHIEGLCVIACRSYQLSQWQSHDPLAVAGVGQMLTTAGDDGRVRLLSYPCVVDDAPAR